MTGSKNGTVSLWKDKELVMSKKIFTQQAQVIAENQTIIAASINEDIVELNNELDTIKVHRGTGCRQKPIAMAANEEYLVVGYSQDYGEHGEYEYSNHAPSKITIKGRRNNGHGLQISEVNLLFSESVRLKNLRPMQVLETLNESSLKKIPCIRVLLALCRLGHSMIRQQSTR